MFRRPIACLSLCVATLLAAPVVAQENSFDGVYYQGQASACGTIGQDGGAIQIKERTFLGVESQCEMTRPVNVVDMDATLFDMKCTGEGEEWQARAMFMSAADRGLIMVWDGFAFQYARCSAEDLPASEDASAQ